MAHLVRFLSLTMLCYSFFFNVVNAQDTTERAVMLEELIGASAYKEMNRKLYDAAITGKIKSYKDRELKVTYTSEEVFKIGRETEEIEVFDEASGEYYDTVLYHELNLGDIEDFLISEIWSYSSEKTNYTVNLKAFAFSLNLLVEGVDLGREPLFWVAFDDFSKVLTDAEIKNFLSALLEITKKMYTEE